MVLAPSLVVVVGVFAALLMAALGTRELRLQSDQAAALRQVARMLQTAIRIAARGFIIVHGELVFEGRTVAELEQNDLVKNYYLGAA